MLRGAREQASIITEQASQPATIWQYYFIKCVYNIHLIHSMLCVRVSKIFTDKTTDFTHAILIVTLGFVVVVVAVIVIKRIVLYRIVVRTTVQQRCVCIQTRTVFFTKRIF